MPSVSAKVSVALVAVGIPTWDVPFEYYNFRTKCQDEGGLRVFHRLEPQEAILVDRSFPATVDDLAGLGFDRIETLGRDAQVYVHDLPNGKRAPARKIEASTAKVRIRADSARRVGWHLTRYDYFAEEIQSRRIIARHSAFIWAGGWVMALASPFLGIGAECSYGQVVTFTRALRFGA